VTPYVLFEISYLVVPYLSKLELIHGTIEKQATLVSGIYPFINNMKQSVLHAAK